MSDASDEIGELLDTLAARAGEIAADDTLAGREYRRGRVVFAARGGHAVELRLHREIAEAARRTPDTDASKRGPEWVRFAPPKLDGHARDRLEAWFLSAWRAASRG